MPGLLKNFVLLTVALAAVVALSLVAPGVSEAQEGKTWTMSFQTVAPANTPWARQLERLKKKWEAESGDRLKVKIFLGRGNETALVKKCQAGELQAIGVSTAAIADEVPEMGVFELPYLFDNPKQADKVIDNHLFNPVEALLKESGFQLLIFSENGYRNFATKGKVIKTPADLEALKMRTQESWIHEETYKALGGNPVRISVAEVLTSLSTNQVNGFDNTPLFAFATSWFTEIDTWTVSDHIYQPAVVVFNKQWFDSLPPDLQTMLLGVRAEETPKGREAVRALTPKLMDKLKEKKITVYEMTPAEKAVFAQKTKKVHAEFRKKTGAKGSQLLDLIEKNK
jgi:TRAP-type C4-dicarboxylate transport system substrate-binding protein